MTKTTKLRIALMTSALASIVGCANWSAGSTIQREPAGTKSIECKLPCIWGTRIFDKWSDVSAKASKVAPTKSEQFVPLKIREVFSEMILDSSGYNTVSYSALGDDKKALVIHLSAQRAPESEFDTASQWSQVKWSELFKILGTPEKIEFSEHLLGKKWNPSRNFEFSLGFKLNETSDVYVSYQIEGTIPLPFSASALMKTMSSLLV